MERASPKIARGKAKRVASRGPEDRVKNMKRKANNYAFIDSQNLNLGIQKLGWKLDYRKFRVYLSEKYSVRKAHVFVGFVALNQKLYDSLQEAGFILKFKPTIPDASGKIKGNVDADLVVRALLECHEYDKAVIVSSDGDFYSLVQYLYEENKLEVVLSPDVKNCSSLLKQTAKEKVQFMNNLQKMLEYKKKGTA
jgi:uncharacterized LabA/DUF88 family protein